MRTTHEHLSNRPLPQLLTLSETCDETRYLLRLKDGIHRLRFQTDFPEIRALLESLNDAANARQKEVFDQMELLSCGSPAPAIPSCTVSEYRLDSRIIAEKLGVEHRALLQLLATYTTKIQHFGTFAFEMRKSAGRPTRYALLNENQCYLLATLSRNTDRVVDFKVWLVKTFAEHRADVQPVPVSEEKVLQLEPVPILEDYFTVSGYISFHGYRLALPTAQDIGKQCARMSRELGYHVHKVRHDIYGQINAYHYKVLKAVTGLPTDELPF